MATLGNRAKETTITQGTGTYSLEGPATGFQSLKAGAAKVSGDGSGPWTVRYVVTDETDWEIGSGTLTSGTPDTLTRGSIEDSSNGGSAVNWGSGTRNVFIALSGKSLADLIDNAKGNGFLKRTGTDAYDVVADPVPIGNGGTGAATASAARTALGVDYPTLDGFYVNNAGNTPSIAAGTLGSRPAAGTAGRWYLATDQTPMSLARDNGASWDDILFTPPAVPPRGQLYRSSDSVLKLRPYMGTAVHAVIDGVPLAYVGELSFDVSAAEGGESSSTWYYLYLGNNSGALDPKISTTAPDQLTGSKPGYHPSGGIGNGYLCCGSWYNDASSNLLRGHVANGWIRYARQVDGVEYALSTTVPQAWTTRSLNLPQNAWIARLVSVVSVVDARIVFGLSTASVALGTGNSATLADQGQDDVVDWMGGNSSGTEKTPDTSTLEIPIADPTTPAIEYGAVLTGGSGAITENRLQLVGYFDPYFPRF